MHLKPLTEAKNRLSWKEEKHKAATETVNFRGLRPKAVFKGGENYGAAIWREMGASIKKGEHNLWPGMEREQ